MTVPSGIVIINEKYIIMIYIEQTFLFHSNNKEDSNGKRKLDEAENENDNKKANLETSFVTGVPLTTMPGHTGYLTFATLQPDLSESS